MSVDWRSSLLVVLATMAVVAFAWSSLPEVLAEYPTVRAGVKMTDKGVVPWETIGESVQGRPIKAARFGKGEKKILYLGGAHGHEFGSDVADKLAEYLADHPSATPKGVERHIIGCLNPDGRAKGTGPNANWVNLNRNMPTHNWAPRRPGLWGAGAPGSEPETKALLAYLTKRFDVVVSLHSKGPLIDYDGPGSEVIADRMSAISGIPAGHIPYSGPMTGSLGVFVPERYAAPVITVELADRELSAPLREALIEGVL